MAPSISVAENVSFLSQSPSLQQVVNVPYSLTDAICSICEFNILTIPVGTTAQNIGTTTTLFGQITTGLKTLIISDAPCILNVTFTTGAEIAIPLTNVFLINSPIEKITVDTPTAPANLTIVIAGN
jgi:hypothetical protein